MKFKVGDNVKVKETKGFEKYANKVGTIDDITNDMICVDRFPIAFYEDELELVEEK